MTVTECFYSASFLQWNSSLLHNMGFRVEVQETLRRKLRGSAVPEFQPITYQSTSSASPGSAVPEFQPITYQSTSSASPSALSDYSNKSQISFVHYSSTSQACRRNAMNPRNVVIPNGSSAQPALAPRCSTVQPAVEGSSVYQNSFYEPHNIL